MTMLPNSTGRSLRHLAGFCEVYWWIMGVLNVEQVVGTRPAERKEACLFLMFGLLFAYFPKSDSRLGTDSNDHRFLATIPQDF